MSANQIVFLDLEVAFWQVWEICLLDEQGEVLYQSFVKPSGDLERRQKTTIENKGIALSNILKAPEWHQIEIFVKRMVENKTVVSWNIDHEIKFLSSNLQNCAQLKCAMKRFSPWFSKREFKSFTDKSNVEYRFVSLVDAAKDLKISRLKGKGFHRAYTDAEIMRKIWLIMDDYDRKKSNPLSDLT